jgi:osmotically inducible protein OsmC
MSFVRLLGMMNFVPEQFESKSEVVIDNDGDSFSVTSVHLTVAAKIPGNQAAFQSIAAKAKAGCPISKLTCASPVIIDGEALFSGRKD